MDLARRTSAPKRVSSVGSFTKALAPKELVETASFKYGSAGQPANSISVSGWLPQNACRFVVCGAGTDAVLCELSCDLRKGHQAAAHADTHAHAHAAWLHAEAAAEEKAHIGHGYAHPAWSLENREVRIVELYRLRQLGIANAVSIDTRAEVVAMGGEAKVLQVWHVGHATRQTADGERLPELLLDCKSVIHVRRLVFDPTHL
jgi:hypothetical protein